MASACPGKMEPFIDHPDSWMSHRLKKETSVKATVVLLGIVHTRTVSLLLYPLTGGEK